MPFPLPRQLPVNLFNAMDRKNTDQHACNQKVPRVKRSKRQTPRQNQQCPRNILTAYQITEPACQTTELTKLSKGLCHHRMLIALDSSTKGCPKTTGMLSD